MKTSDLRNANVKLIRQVSTGKLGLSFNHEVHASTKKQWYNTETIVTKNNILITTCACKAGGDGKKKVVCVHSLVLLL